MVFVDYQNIKGHYKIYLYPKGQDYKNYLVVDKNNLIVTAGKNLVKNLISGQDTSFLQSFALGTSIVPPTLTDTELGNVIEYDTGLYYKAFEEYTNDSATSITYVGYLSNLQPLTQPVDISEIGLFTGLDANKGTMFCRATFAPITKTQSLEIRIEYTLSFV
jgi:hypothetical protein